jgi:formylglycine-generating enzyme required for sulfatase activity
MDTVEVTSGLFRKITGASVRPFQGAEACPSGPEFPVQAVSLWEAMLFCNKRSAAEGLDSCYSLKDFRDTAVGRLVYKRDGVAKTDSYFIRLDTVRNFQYREDGRKNGYRIPDVTEMEYADRAGSTRKYFWGDDPDAAPQYGWFAENSGGCAHAVGTKTPNPFGLHDVSGNLVEWCFFRENRFMIYGIGYSRSPSYVTSNAFCMDNWGRENDMGFRCVRRAE